MEIDNPEASPHEPKQNRIMIGCVIFDCDGTLVDSELLCNQALELKLRECGVEESAESMLQRYRGGKLADILSDLSARHRIELADTFVRDYRLAVAALFQASLQPIDGVIGALRRIAKPMCVASSGPPEKIEQALRLTGLSGFFGGNIFSSYTVNSWKPEPSLFLHAARQMRVAPTECVVVDDSPLGIEAARRAGMRAILFAPGGASAVADEQSVQLLRRMDALPDLLAEEERRARQHTVVSS